MIKGIGIDIVELDRIREALDKNKRIQERILTSRELDMFHQLSPRRQVEFLAGRFAAKEAFSKAWGTGIGGKLSFHDLEIGVDENGRPYFQKPAGVRAHLSIAHERHYAVAQVVIEEKEKPKSGEN